MMLIPIFLSILNFVESSPSEFVDPNCPDYDLSLVCTSKCEDELVQCVSTCSSSDCLMECYRAAFVCGDSCPCRTDCINGCQGCDNPICFCNDDSNDDNLNACLNKTSKNLGQCILDCNDDSNCETACVFAFKNEHSECPCQGKCPLGCPCDNYDCDLPDNKAILTLYSRNSYPSVLIQQNGGVNENFEFKINDDTEVTHSCSASLNDEVFVFGGYNTSNNRRKQISKIIGCELKRIGDLSYEFYRGACGTYNFPEERVMLCFSSKYHSKCESYDGSVFHNQANSKNEHYYTTLANIDDAPLAVGANNPNTNKAEILNISSNTWTEIADYPYHNYIYAYATVTTSRGAIFIGGYGNTAHVATVACYNKAGWTRLDDLQSVRRDHRAIINGDKVYVIGGQNTKYTEIWSDDDGSKNIKLADPKLYAYQHYPELILVDTQFCVNP